LGVSRCGFVIALGVCAACGKKGPPLSPLVPIPAAVEQIEANRLGSDVYVSLTIPATNVDKHTPADLARVEIYAYTGRSAPPRARWVELATLVAAVPVAQPPLKPEEKPESTRTADEPANAPVQGSQITVRDALTPDELVQGKEAPALRGPGAGVRDPNAEPGTSNTGMPNSRIPDAERRTPDPGSRPPDPGPVIPDPGPVIPDPGPRTPDPVVLKRFYIGVPFNSKGRPGPPGGVAEFPLVSAPDAPPSVNAGYTERSIMLEWEPSGGLLGFLLERVLPDEPPPFDEEEGTEQVASTEPSGPVSYTVYRELPSDPLTPPAPSAASWNEEMPAAITPIPVPTVTFTDSVELGRRRCYTVRAVRGVGPDARIGDASPPACVTPTDIFAPAPPRSVTTVASEGAISLIWEPNTELDLGGYVVLRGEAPGDTLLPLTKAPVPNAGYRDETVTPGVRYVYAIIAVDNRFPIPNMSGTSEPVEETAR
jgi:hypothetical protein